MKNKIPKVDILSHDYKIDEIDYKSYNHAHTNTLYELLEYNPHVIFEYIKVRHRIEFDSDISYKQLNYSISSSFNDIVLSIVEPIDYRTNNVLLEIQEYAPNRYVANLFPHIIKYPLYKISSIRLFLIEMLKELVYITRKEKMKFIERL